MSLDPAFRFQIRPDPDNHAAIMVRFDSQQGMGLLGFGPTVGDPPPAAHLDHQSVDIAQLRAGRFVHILGEGQRQSYALSRVTPEAILRLPPDTWTPLEPVTEYGFRYLVIPPEILQRVPEAASVQVSAPLPAPAPRSVPEPGPTPEPAVRVEVPRQVPMEPSLALRALEHLDRDEAIAYLRQEMAKVEQLHQELDTLRRALEQSQARESDLLEILGRWQER